MSKKNKRTRKVSEMTIDAMTIWNAQKPRYNGYACGHGTHGDTKYNRRKVRKMLEREEW